MKITVENVISILMDDVEAIERLKVALETIKGIRHDAITGFDIDLIETEIDRLFNLIKNHAKERLKKIEFDI